MKNLHKKFKLFLLATIILSTSYTVAQQNFPHIKTFGFDYIRFQDNNGAFLDNLRWLANHHDWIVGPKGNWASQGVDYLDELTYDTIKTENPNTKIMMYFPYHSMAPTTQTWLENWATKKHKYTMRQIFNIDANYFSFPYVHNIHSIQVQILFCS